MKILTIKVYGFGKWQDQQFDLSKNLTILSGPNEAGKSTLRQFILSILFGFRTKRGTDRYLRYEPKNGSKYGGELLIEVAQKQYLLKRVKGKNGGKLTITNLETQEIMKNEVLDSWLGAVDETLFNEMFSFGESELAEVRQLSRDDFRKRVLKIGAVGSDQWINLQNKFEKDADKVYAPKGRVRPLNKLLKQHDELSQQVEQAASETELYQQQAREASKNTVELDTIQTAIADYQIKVDRLEHVVDGWKTYQKYQETQQQMRSDVQEISATELQAIEHDHQQVDELTQTIHEVQEKIANLKQAVASDARMAFYHDHAAQLSEISQQLASFQDVAKQEVALQEKQQEIKAEEAQIKRQLGTEDVVATPFTEQEFSQLKHILADRNDNEQNKQAVQDKIVALQNQLLKGSGQAEQKATFRLTTIFLIIGIICLIFPWLLPWAVGVKLIVSALGLVAVIGSYVVRPHTNKEPSLQEDLATNLAQLKSKLVTVDKDSDRFDEQLTALGKTKALTGDPQTWLGMQNNLERYELLQKKQADVQEQQNVNKQQIEDFETRIQILSPWVKLNGEFTQQLANVVAYFQSIQQSEQAVQKDTQDLHYYQERLDKLKKEQERVQTNLENLLNDVHLKDWTAFQDAKELQTQQAQLRAVHDQLFQQLGKETLNAMQQYENQSEAQNELDTEMQQLKQLRQKQEKIVAQKTVLTTKMQQLADDQTYAHLQQQLANLEAEILAVTKDWLTDELTAQWIDETLLVASQGRLPKIMTNAQRYFSLLTSQRYNKIDFDAQTIVVTDQMHQTYEVGELSQGTAEQLYVAIRLAFVSVMADLIDLPIIIDDGFVNFDAERKKNVMVLLMELSGHHQVIYFTAQKIEDTLNETTRLIDLSDGSIINGR